MKKNLTISLIALLMSVVFCNVNAQSKNPTYSKGYSGNDINDLKYDGLSQGMFGNTGPYFGVTFKF